MRSEKEIRELLEKLEEVYSECDKELNGIFEGRSPDYRKCEISVDGYTIFTDYDHNGIKEWIVALRWVLGEKIEPTD